MRNSSSLSGTPGGLGNTHTEDIRDFSVAVKNDCFITGSKPSSGTKEETGWGTTKSFEGRVERDTESLSRDVAFSSIANQSQLHHSSQDVTQFMQGEWPAVRSPGNPARLLRNSGWPQGAASTGSVKTTDAEIDDEEDISSEKALEVYRARCWERQNKALDEDPFGFKGPNQKHSKWPRNGW
jgi:hypothetical protein